MRSDEQRDICIDTLFARVKALEGEVAKLKGEAVPEPQQATERAFSQPAPEAPVTFVFSEQEPERKPPTPRDSSLESAIGTRWIGRIGVLAILFAVAFFLKYSFDNKLIGETGRVMLGIFWGIAFIGGGEYLQKKKNMRLYGQMLTGGGLGVLYLALYAAFALYHLLPAPLAAAAMVAVTTTGMTLSIRYSAYSLAAIALAGGLLTPIMLSTGKNQPLALFGYILLLDLGTLLLLRFRRWPSLVAASLFGTILLYAAWHSEYYNEPQRPLAFAVVAVFFLFYNLYILISRLYSSRDESMAERMVIFASAGFFFLAVFYQYHHACVWPLKIFTLALAGVELAMAEIIRRKAPAANAAVTSYLAASMIMTVVATFVALEQRWILPALAAEMAALAWMGLRLETPALRRGGYLLALMVIVQFVVELEIRLEPFENLLPVFNPRFLACACAVLGFYLVMSFAVRYRDRLNHEERHLVPVAFIIAQALSLVLLSVEVHDFFRFRAAGQMLGWGDNHYAYQLSLSVLWAVYASVLTGVGILKRLRGARMLGILLLGATILKVFLVDLSALETFYRIISFVVLGLLLLSVSYGYNRFKHLIFGEDS